MSYLVILQGTPSFLVSVKTKMTKKIETIYRHLTNNLELNLCEVSDDFCHCRGDYVKPCLARFYVIFTSFLLSFFVDYTKAFQKNMHLINVTAGTWLALFSGSNY